MNTPAVFPTVVQTQSWLEVCVDVSKDSLSWLAEDSRGARSDTGVVENRNEAILEWLRHLLAQAGERQLAGVRIVCESTSGYHRRLLRLARSLDCRTALVSGEQVNRLQVVESNDTGKSDQKDPRTMMLLVRLGKTLTDRALDREWAALREWDACYTTLERDLTRAKNRIHALLVQLFPDLSFKKDWLFEGAAARVVLKHYAMDPFRILGAGEAAFRRRLRQDKLRPSTIKRLWADAQEAIKQPSSPLWREVIAQQLRHAYEDLAQAQERCGRVRQHMITLLEQLQANGEVKLRARSGLITPFLLARILAQTGPLTDFRSIRQLWRYAGMNLRPKQSGTVRGKERQAKRGRARLRHVLSQAILKLVVRGALYGEYYHRKRAGGMLGPVAMTAVARKFLKLLFGLERSKRAFDPHRVFTCESAIAPQAA